MATKNPITVCVTSPYRINTLPCSKDASGSATHPKPRTESRIIVPSAAPNRHPVLVKEVVPADELIE